MRFRVSNTRDWAAEFDAATPQELAQGIRAATASKLTTQGKGGHPLIALRRRLNEVDAWLAERLQREGSTPEALNSWRLQAANWRTKARLSAGMEFGMQLHVQTDSGDWINAGRRFREVGVQWDGNADDLAKHAFPTAERNLDAAADLDNLIAWVAETIPRGGAREGAGRKQIEGLRPYSVKLDQETADRLRALGGGNLTEGIRLAAKSLPAAS